MKTEIERMRQVNAELVKALMVLERAATKMLAGGFNGKPKQMHEAIGNATSNARELIKTFENK